MNVEISSNSSSLCAKPFTSLLESTHCVLRAIYWRRCHEHPWFMKEETAGQGGVRLSESWRRPAAGLGRMGVLLQNQIQDLQGMTFMHKGGLRSPLWAGEIWAETWSLGKDKAKNIVSSKHMWENPSGKELPLSRKSKSITMALGGCLGSWAEIPVHEVWFQAPRKLLCETDSLSPLQRYRDSQRRLRSRTAHCFSILDALTRAIPMAQWLAETRREM